MFFKKIQSLYRPLKVCEKLHFSESQCWSLSHLRFWFNRLGGLFTLVAYFIHFDKTVFTANCLRAGYTFFKKEVCDKMHGRNPTVPVKINLPTQKKKTLKKKQQTKTNPPHWHENT